MSKVMHWWTIGVTVLVIFNGLEYSMAEGEKSNCDDSGKKKVSEALGCGSQRLQMGIIITGRNDPLVDRACCTSYYTSCLVVKAVRKHCSPTSEYTDGIEKEYQNLMKCSPSKDKCKDHHKEVKDCDQYMDSECENYSWSSVTPISLNGWALFISLVLSVLVFNYI